jgi:UDP-glucose 4-epimerase
MKTSSDTEQPKKFLITGGCGFIGTNLIDKLMREPCGYQIRVLDNLLVGTKKDLSAVCDFVELELRDILDRTINSVAELVVGDITDYETCMSCAKGVDVIVHLAASTGVPISVKHPRSDMRANVIGTFNMLEAARTQNVSKFIFASSGAPVGEVTPPIHEELAPHPASPYGASKLAGEGYCSAYNQTFGIDTVALRFGNVYGPRSNHKSSVVAKFIRQAVKGETLQIYGDGKQTRDFIYIDDLIEAIMAAYAKDGIGGEVFQVATNAETTVKEMANQLAETMATKGFNSIRISHVEARLGDVLRNYSDTSKAAKMLGWKVRTGLAQGLEKTIDWFLHTFV